MPPNDKSEIGFGVIWGVIVACIDARSWWPLELFLQAARAGLSWQEGLARANGTYYHDQVDIAAKEYMDKQPEATIHAEGYQKFLDLQGKK